MIMTGEDCKSTPVVRRYMGHAEILVGVGLNGVQYMRTSLATHADTETLVAERLTRSKLCLFVEYEMALHPGGTLTQKYQSKQVDMIGKYHNTLGADANGSRRLRSIPTVTGQRRVKKRPFNPYCHGNGTHKENGYYTTEHGDIPLSASVRTHVSTRILK